MFDKNKLSNSYPTSFSDRFIFFSFSCSSISLNLLSSIFMLFETYSSGLSSAFLISVKIFFEFADVVLNGKYLLFGLPVVRDIEFTWGSVSMNSSRFSKFDYEFFDDRFGFLWWLLKICLNWILLLRPFAHWLGSDPFTLGVYFPPIMFLDL